MATFSLAFALRLATYGF
uniref:Uncharacterized protein n=1 Tax=Anguilla anguilla TaxID=7936 RepID=A0A0E9R1Y3_ANGAN